jgi:putative membrane protein
MPKGIPGDRLVPVALGRYLFPCLSDPGTAMRYLYIALIVIATGAVVLFKIQNLSSVSVSFITMSVTMPVAIMVILIYVLGMVTGGAVVSLLRTWMQEATRKTAE